MGSLTQELIGWEGERDKLKSPPGGLPRAVRGFAVAPYVACQGAEPRTQCESLSHGCGMNADLTVPVVAG